MNRKLRMGMVGGGTDSFTGPVHRIAAQMDNKIELACGVFSSSPEKSKLTGRDLLLPHERVYFDYEEMFDKESKLPLDERIDFVSIITPNNMHYPIAVSALEHGFHVLCEKPMTTTLKEAKDLEQKVAGAKKLFCLTHNYTGYPMVKEARRLVLEDQLGKLRRVVVEYPQGWLSKTLEHQDDKQIIWRTSPEIAGASGCMGDLGTHCGNLVEYITGLRITSVSADLSIFIDGGSLDDDGSVLIRLGDSVKGILWASQVAIGHENSLGIRIYGEKGSLEWHQEEPNTLLVRWPDKPTELRRTATDFLGNESFLNTRIPAGHPEGYLEGFANIYSAFASDISSYIMGTNNILGDYPSVHDGVHTMALINALLDSNINHNKWVNI